MGYTWVKPGGYQAGDGPMCYLNKWYNGITAHPLLHHRQPRRDDASADLGASRRA